MSAPADFTIGVNFPWVTCGHDFGPRPGPWSGAPPTDWEIVERELNALRADGVTSVRWWVLAGGVNVPCGDSVATIARRVPFLDPWPRWQRPLLQLTRRRLPERWEPLGALPPLPAGFLQDFERLLEACARAEVKLWPSLMSFELFLPLEVQAKGVTSGGRGAFALGPRRGAFLDATLEPLLEVSERHRGAIECWEVVNEPGWSLSRGASSARHGAHPPWVSASALSDLIVDGALRIARRGLVSTVGFLNARPDWLPTSALASLRRLAERGAYVHQLHHYPGVTKVRALPAASASPILPCVVGEVPTSRHARWSDPGLVESDDETYLERRLSRVAELGYSGALLWAHRATDPHVRWDAGTRAQVRRAASRHVPP